MTAWMPKAVARQAVLEKELGGVEGVKRFECCSDRRTPTERRAVSNVRSMLPT